MSALDNIHPVLVALVNDFVVSGEFERLLKKEHVFPAVAAEAHLSQEHLKETFVWILSRRHHNELCSWAEQNQILAALRELLNISSGIRDYKVLDINFVDVIWNELWLRIFVVLHFARLESIPLDNISLLVK